MLNGLLISMFKCVIGDVRRYYGEGVGFYFAFLEMLTWSLIGPSCLGLIHTYFPPTQFEAQIVFCMLYMIWAFGLMEVKFRFPIVPIVQLSLVENVVNRQPSISCPCAAVLEKAQQRTVFPLGYEEQVWWWSRRTASQLPRSSDDRPHNRPASTVNTLHNSWRIFSAFSLCKYAFS